MRNEMIEIERLALVIHRIRGAKVILDRDLAELYGVETRALKQAVRRNRERFPEDFMFVLTKEELSAWRSQNVMSKEEAMGLRHLPMAFTEQGVAMLSSVLRSRCAVEVNIAIMRTFVQLRTLMDGNRELARRIEILESKYNQQFKVVFDAIRRLFRKERSEKCRDGRLGFIREGTYSGLWFGEGFCEAWA